MRRKEQRQGEWIPATTGQANRGIVKYYKTTADLWTILIKDNGFQVERVASGGRNRGIKDFWTLTGAEDYILWVD